MCSRFVLIVFSDGPLRQAPARREIRIHPGSSPGQTFPDNALVVTMPRRHSFADHSRSRRADAHSWGPPAADWHENSTFARPSEMSTWRTVIALRHRIALVVSRVMHEDQRQVGEAAPDQHGRVTQSLSV